MKDEKENTKEEIIRALNEMISSYEKLPPHALYGPVLQADHYSLLLLLAAFLREMSSE